MKTKIVAILAFAICCIGTLKAQQVPDFAGMMANKADLSTVPDSYSFSWKYTMEIQTEGGKAMTANYLLEKNASYFGMNIEQKGNSMLMVMDTKNQITVTTFGKGDQKMAMANKMKDYAAMAGKQSGDKKFTYKPLPDKTILGYKCKGVEATDADYTMILYFTNDAPVNFADMFKSQQAQKMPDMFKDYFKPGDKPLMMSVDITDKAKAKTTSMKCVGLEKNAFVFKKADYKFM
jgi:hypothetical protein